MIFDDLVESSDFYYFTLPAFCVLEYFAAIAAVKYLSFEYFLCVVTPHFSLQILDFDLLEARCSLIFSNQILAY